MRCAPVSMEHSEDIKRVKSTPRHRSVSPRLNQLLQLFQSKAHEHTPTCGHFKKERAVLCRERNVPEQTSIGNGNHLPNSKDDHMFKPRKCLSYSSYNSSLKKSSDLDTRLSSISSSEEKSIEVGNPHSRTPYSRDKPLKRYGVSRQKSFQKNRDTATITKESSYDKQESPTEQLNHVNFLLKGSSTRLSNQESKDLGYCTDTSSKSLDRLDSERNYHAEIKDYCLTRPKPSLDEIMKQKLVLGEEDHFESNNKEERKEFNRSLNSQDCSDGDSFKGSQLLNDHSKTTSDPVKQSIEANKNEENNNLLDSPSPKNLSEIMTTPKEEDDRFSDNFHILRSQTDSTLKNRKRKPLTRSKSAVIMKPPRRLCVSESDEGIQLSENGFLQIVNDIKGMKTCLLKLKRELQEAPIVSPLSTLSTGSQRFFDDSLLKSSPSSASRLEESGSVLSARPRKLVRRTTVDSCLLRSIRSDDADADSRTLSETFLPLNKRKVIAIKTKSCKDYDEEFPSVKKLQSLFEKNEDQSECKDGNLKNDKEENEQLKKELSALKHELEQVKQERNCHFIAREELEHELNTKNYTIKLLQTQLEGQESRDEVENLKEQVKALKVQMVEKQNEIFDLVHDGTPSPSQSINNGLKSKNYWSELRVKLKDAMITTSSPCRAVDFSPQTTAFHLSDILTLKKSEVE